MRVSDLSEAERFPVGVSFCHAAFRDALDKLGNPSIVVHIHPSEYLEAVELLRQYGDLVTVMPDCEVRGEWIAELRIGQTVFPYGSIGVE